MSTYIKKVSIFKLWNYKDIICNLYDDVNILIGSNGTGKTTFLNIVESVLNVELQKIEEIDFERVEILLSKDGIEHTIKVTRESAENMNYVFHYNIDMEASIDIVDLHSPFSRGRIALKKAGFYVKEKISDLINVSWLSITRFDNDDDSRSDEIDIDKKLRQLMRSIVSYKLELETLVSERTRKLNESLVSLLLYDESIDKFPTLETFEKIYTMSDEELRTEIYQVFHFFGNPKEHADKINLHVKRIQLLKDITSNRDKKSMGTMRCHSRY